MNENNEQVENTASEITQQEVTESTEENSGLNITDLAQVKMIIDVAASRGAFKPAEMTIIGATYNKIVSFLESVTKGN